MSIFKKVSSSIGIGILIGIGVLIIIKTVKKIKKNRIIRRWIYADGEEPTCV